MKQKSTITLVFIGTLLVLVAIMYLSIADFGYLFGSQSTVPAHSWRQFRSYYQSRPPYSPTVVEVGSIKSWMTFAYINRIFNLPNDYLKTQLKITAKKYPAVTLDEVAELQHEASTDYLGRVKSTVADYLASNALTK